MTGKSSIFRLAAALILGGLLTLCPAAPRIAVSAEKEARVGFATLTSAQLAGMMLRKDFYLVNVHTPYEGEIRDTDAFIVFDKIGANLDKLPQNKDERIVLYCQSGRMSEIAALELGRLGYSRVSHLGGGMIDWKKHGYEIIEGTPRRP